MVPSITSRILPSIPGGYDEPSSTRTARSWSATSTQDAVAAQRIAHAPRVEHPRGERLQCRVARRVVARRADGEHRRLHARLPAHARESGTDAVAVLGREQARVVVHERVERGGKLRRRVRVRVRAPVVLRVRAGRVKRERECQRGKCRAGTEAKSHA
jgi:hypothetical protein